jgi:hypothetical protein
MSNAQVFAKLQSGLDEVQTHFKDEFLARVVRRTPRKSGTLAEGWTGTVEPGSITISNPVEYAGFIEYGTQHIEPRGMLRTTVEESEQILDIAMKKAGLV